MNLRRRNTVTSIFTVPKSFNSREEPKLENQKASSPTEESCVGKFRCHDGSGCIATWLTCDEVDHCADRSDETGCGKNPPF